MKKINVIVKDKTILELTENAQIGDIIDLQEIVQVDTSYIDAIIENGKDKAYASKLEDTKKIIRAEKELEINKLTIEIENLKKENNNLLKLKEQEVEKKYLEIVSSLENKILLLENNQKNEIQKINFEKEKEIQTIEQKYQSLLDKFDLEIKQNKLELDNLYQEQINKLKNEQSIINENHKYEMENQKNLFIIEKEKEFQNLKESYNLSLKEKEDTINSLQRSRAAMNVKRTGEDLESWCNNEVISYMQNGLFNCTWEKDNLVVKNEDEQRGSKADYLFKVYASEQHLHNELLASVCLDMKDENPDSIAKKKNADYYKKLDENRVKKECKYAVLVSNLEIDRPNDLPIFKVLEYENMYVVRPAYLMVFLNMIASLSKRFSDLILNNEKENLELKTKNDLIEEFNQIKETYLDKPLEALNKALEAILASSEDIKKASRKIDENCDKVKRSYLAQINDKLSKFELKLERNIIKKIE